MALRSRVFWLLSGGINIPSSRIHGFNIHRQLLELGYSSTILFHFERNLYNLPIKPTQFKRFLGIFSSNDSLVIQKFKDPHTLAFILFLKKNIPQLRIVFIDCDLPISQNIAENVDILICPSQYLCQKYQNSGIKNVTYIPDSPEKFDPDNLKGQRSKKEKFKGVWFGVSTPKRWADIQNLKNQIILNSEINWKLETITNHPQADYPWSLDVYSELKNYDAVFIPCFNPTEAEKVKSANRLLQSMALGIPVLSSPIPAYLEIIVNQKNGFICYTKDDWLSALKQLENQTFSNKIRKNAFTTSQSYQLKKIIPQWIETLSLDKVNSPLENSVEKHLSSLRNKVYLSLSVSQPRYFNEYISKCSLSRFPNYIKILYGWRRNYTIFSQRFMYKIKKIKDEYNFF